VLTDGTAASLDGARKAAIQRLAAIAGYDPGPADGVYRAKTLAALTRFQTARGLADAGLMSDALVEALYEAAVQAGEAATATGSIDEAPAE
jgi:peptidoglycan hydrolase-like protein with peptidoglycan-binding domain